MGVSLVKPTLCLPQGYKAGPGKKVSDSANKQIHLFSQRTFRELLLCAGMGHGNIKWEHKAEGRG